MVIARFAAEKVRITYVDVPPLVLIYSPPDLCSPKHRCGQNSCFPIYSGIGQNLPEYTRYVLTSVFCQGKVYVRGTLVLGTRY
jgi:hypothetical protein